MTSLGGKESRKHQGRLHHQLLGRSALHRAGTSKVMRCGNANFGDRTCNGVSELNIYAILTASAALAAAFPMGARAESPIAVCQRVGTDDDPRPIPKELVPAINAVFATRMPAREAMDTTVFRCSQGHVLVCTVGANLPCGKANTSREPNPGIIQWCQANADADFVPAAVTGHDTIYQWRCKAGAAQIVRQTLSTDPRGFVAEYWKPLR